MEIVAYTLPGCSHCKSLKELFRRANADYTEVVVKQDITMEEFVHRMPGITHFPYVVIDGENLGGLVDTVKLFVERGLVSSSKE